MTPDKQPERPPHSHDFEAALEEIYSHGGEPLDLLYTLRTNIHDDEVSARLANITVGMSGNVLPPEDSPWRPVVKRALVTEKFLQTVGAVAKKSDNLEYFSWALSGVTDSRARELDAFAIDKGTERTKVVQLGVVRLIAASTLMLHDFCDNNPEHEDKAIENWQDSINHLHGLALVAQGMRSHLSEVTAKSAMGPQRRRRISRMDAILEPTVIENRWRKGTIPAYQGSKRPRVQLSGLELVPIGRLELEDVKTLHDQLLEGEFRAPQPMQLIAQSLNATVNFLHSLRHENELSNVMQLRNRKQLVTVDNFLQSRKSHGSSIGYADMIKLANLITLQVQGEHELEQLDPKALEDYPKAVDRLLLMALAKDNQQEEKPNTKDKRELFAAAAACIKLLAFQGAEHKLQQRVLTLGDVLLRYQGLKKEDADNLLAQVRLGSSEVAVQGLYRHLYSRRSKIHASYRRFDRGYGYLS